jgi:hypothetical protein
MPSELEQKLAAIARQYANGGAVDIEMVSASLVVED